MSLHSVLNFCRMNVTRCRSRSIEIDKLTWAWTNSTTWSLPLSSRFMSLSNRNLIDLHVYTSIYTSYKLAVLPSFKHELLQQVQESNVSQGQNGILKRFYMKRKTRKIQPTKVLNFDYGGDQTYDDYPLDLTEIRVELDGAKQLERVDELTRRMLSIEYGDGQDKHKRRIHNVLTKVMEHPLDVRSLEVNIAYQTVSIRNHIRHVTAYRKDKAAKCLLVLRLQARRKHMRRLRASDYEKFSWLCQELQIKYIPVPYYNRKPSKASNIKNEARRLAFTTIKEKKEIIKVKLAVERDVFAKYKHKELYKIGQEIISMELNNQSHIVKVYSTLKNGNILDLDGKLTPLKARGRSILEQKFKLADAIKKQRQAENS